MDYTLNVVSKRCFFFTFKHSLAPKRSCQISHGGPGGWKVLDFFQWKSGNPAYSTVIDFVFVVVQFRQIIDKQHQKISDMVFNIYKYVLYWTLVTGVRRKISRC